VSDLPPGLYVVATPIGNLADITERARTTLASAELIAAEDTRRTRALLTALSIPAPELVRLDRHSGERVVRSVVDRASGGPVALVTDAGTPGVSDPGASVVGAAVAAGVTVVAVPGPSAALAALTASGLPSARFAVEGFLPRKGEARRRRVAAIAADERTTVLFESPHRVAATLADLVGACGPTRAAAVARELTKLHEEVIRGSLAEVAALVGDEVRGEVAIVIGAAPAPEPPSEDVIRAALADVLADGFSTRDAVDRVAGALEVSRRRVYQVALEARDRPAREG
jgi:16S rRNA (cytidine1402-2'-O)-methyltransferase